MTSIAGARQHHQSNRTHNGVESGQLSRSEAKELRSDHREIKAARQEARADGKVTFGEKLEINQMQNKASKGIHEAKHNEETRGEGTPRVDRRQDRQMDRITNGLDQGDLTAREAQRMLGREARIERKEERFKADGDVTPQERARLTELQNSASAAIFKARHDGQTNR